MNIMILGGNGYLGQATTAYLRERGHTVISMDSDIKRDWMDECGVAPLFGPADPPNYIDGQFPQCVASEISEVEAVVHYAEQASAPYSMMRVGAGNTTVLNNIGITLHLIQAIRRKNPKCHIVKLGTMGEYGTPGVDIPEGWFTHSDIDNEYISHIDGIPVQYPQPPPMTVMRTARLPFPKQPGSLYHTSKVMDSDLLEFAARIWGLRVTDLNQGVVYGCETDELPKTRFYYDHIFGTALNRFVAQAVSGHPLTVYGKGGQTRGWLNIRDTLRCVELALKSPADPGTFRVLNQFTETFNVLQLAQRVSGLTGAAIEHIDNPRKEAEEHYYNASNQGFLDLGLEPHMLTDDVLARMIKLVGDHADDIDQDVILPQVQW